MGLLTEDPVPAGFTGTRLGVCNLCEAIYDRSRIDVLPLEGLETFSMNGVRYEAFNTSGGLGTLCETLNGRVRELNYKTIRYPGHRDDVPRQRPHAQSPA